MNEEMAGVRSQLQKARHIVALAGAGLSAASGIPTFRGAGGLWLKYDAMSLATPEAFAKNPSRSWAFYEYRRRKALQARPNDAHIALAKFAQAAYRKELAPNCESFALITQTLKNVDGLSARASADLQAQDSRESKSPLLEMHGNIAEPFCSKCGKTAAFYENVAVVPGFKDIVEQVDTSSLEIKLPKEELPRCRHCSGLLRPGVVWFGEMPKHLDAIDRLLRRADLLLVVGTSSTVYPAASFASQVKRHGGAVAVFNLEASPGDDEADYVIYGKCEETLPAALGV